MSGSPTALFHHGKRVVMGAARRAQGWLGEVDVAPTDLARVASVDGIRKEALERQRMQGSEDLATRKGRSEELSLAHGSNHRVLFCHRDVGEGPSEPFTRV